MNNDLLYCEHCGKETSYLYTTQSKKKVCYWCFNDLTEETEVSDEKTNHKSTEQQ